MLWDTQEVLYNESATQPGGWNFFWVLELVSEGLNPR